MHQSPIEVKLISGPSVAQSKLSSFGAKTCYKGELPSIEEPLLNIKDQLWKTGHHTTLMHGHYTFALEGLSIGSITLGIMHLTSPFYNTGQRSGRYCGKMFTNPDYNQLRDYLNFWLLRRSQIDRVMDYVAKATKVYQTNIDKATEICRQKLLIERPNISPKSLEQLPGKIAQEQLRNFLPIIYPTAATFTVNAIALAALYQSAWSPDMRNIAEQMAEQVIAHDPEIAFMFDPLKRVNQDWSPSFISDAVMGDIKNSPACKLIHIDDANEYSKPNDQYLHPLDLSHFRPEFMDDGISQIITQVEISIATMGQDQRHRTIRRSQPKWTGAFYLPPLATALNLEKEAREIYLAWKKLHNQLPGTLAMQLAPYGAMVRYTKVGSFNAVAHEQAKRLCFNAQEEIYNLSRLLREEIITRQGQNSPALDMFEPPCYRTGICGEGARYCGRDLTERTNGDFFPIRQV